MYLLFALAAGPVGCFHINRLEKLSKSIWRESCERGVSVYPLNKLFKVFYLSFLYFDFFLPSPLMIVPLTPFSKKPLIVPLVSSPNVSSTILNASLILSALRRASVVPVTASTILPVNFMASSIPEKTKLPQLASRTTCISLNLMYCETPVLYCEFLSKP